MDTVAALVRLAFIVICIIGCPAFCMKTLRRGEGGYAALCAFSIVVGVGATLDFSN